MPRPNVNTLKTGVGTSAPDVVLQDSAGQEVRLSGLWSAAPRGLVLVFFRHFG